MDASHTFRSSSLILFAIAMVSVAVSVLFWLLAMLH